MSEFLETVIGDDSRAFQLMQDRLGHAGMLLLDRQLRAWEYLNDTNLHSPLKRSFESGSRILPKGTLLHSTGMHETTTETLKSISEYGLLSGELMGVVEDSETHGCVDFFKVTEESSIDNYMSWAKEKILSGRIIIPRGENLLHRGVSFIVDPAAEGMADLLDYDGYTNSDMKSFINTPSRRSADDTSAILGGVPRGAIAGVIVSDRHQTDLLSEIENYFDVPIFSVGGERLDDNLGTA